MSVKQYSDESYDEVRNALDDNNDIQITSSKFMLKKDDEILF